VEVVWRVNTDPLATNPNPDPTLVDDVAMSVILNVGMKSMVLLSLTMLELRFRSQVPPLVSTLPWSISNPEKTERHR
jgi:hypothetical protein